MRELSVPASFDVGEHDTVVDAVFEHERDHPDLVIYERLVDGHWRAVTAAEAAALIRSAAQGLIAEGVQPGDRVAILSATRFEWAILDFAILAVGALTVPIYETSSAEQVRWVLSDSGAVLVFAESDAHAAMVGELSDELPDLRRVYQIESTGPTALDQLAEAGASVDPAEVTKRVEGIRTADPATLIYTSGTTGRPKGCQLTHSNLVYEIRGAKSAMPTLLNDGERLLVFLPLAHVLARALTIAAFNYRVTVGFTSDIKNLVPLFGVFADHRGLGPAGVREGVQHRRPECGRRRQGQDLRPGRTDRGRVQRGPDRGGPGLLLKLKHAVFDRLVYHKLRAALGGDCRASISGGAPLGARLCHFYRGVGLTIYEGYGLTETSAAIAVNQVGNVRVGTVGKLLPGNSMRVGPDGELLVRGGVVFDGYWKNEQATAEAFDDGWFRTGDLCEVDDDGFIKIVGRKKEIIVTAGGKNVAPRCSRMSCARTR